MSPKDNFVFPMNPSHGISNQTGWVSVISDLFFLGLGLVHLDVKIALSLASPLVSGSAKLFFDLKKFIAITHCLSSCLNKLCLRRISLNLLL